MKDAKREDGLLIGNMRFNLYNNMESEFINISSEYRLLYVGEGNAELICESRCDRLNKGSIVIFYPYENEKMIVSLYYYDELTLKEIGKLLGISESRVSQLHTRALLKLKNKLSVIKDDLMEGETL